MQTIPYNTLMHIAGPYNTLQYYSTLRLANEFVPSRIGYSGLLGGTQTVLEGAISLILLNNVWPCH